MLVYPESESFNILVSLEFLYGTCSEFDVNAWITFPKHDKDKLIFLAYSNVCPFTPDFLTFYEPARSIKHNLHFCSAPLAS